MFRRISTAAALLVTTALVATACSTTPGPDDEHGGRADRLTLVSISAPVSYDIGLGAETGTRSQYFEAVFDTLLQQDAAGDIGPRLATEWEYDDERTRLTLTLRDGVEFTDGTPVDAAAVVASLERLRDGTSQAAGRLTGQEYEVVDDGTVAISLPEPDPGLLSALSTNAGLIASPASFDDPDVETRPVGSGPYVLDVDATVSGTTYSFTANEDYWDADAVHYDNLTINVIADPTAMLNAILAGETDAAAADNRSLAEIEGAGWSLTDLEGSVEGMLLLDRDGTIEPALADVRVRQAINMAFDREALLDALQDGHGTVSEQVFLSTSPSFDPALDEHYGYDPEGAREMLAEAGYPDGFAITMPSIGAYQTTLDLVAQQLADIGITVAYEDPGPGNFVTSVLAPKYAMTWMSVGLMHEWDHLAFLVTPDATFNPFATRTDEVDGLLREIQFGDEEQAATATSALKELLVDEAWFAPFFRVDGHYATSPETTYDADTWVLGSYPSIFGFSPAAAS
ncbi:ABC transporter substrate-binding protein [Microbacterium sp. NPDC089320]|uniref:ABC transporter substrate-binding protein n=1 Tax=Microbacterium sp. NPDC089320 TaxID=3155182 RepID=UPI00342BB96A